jgi:hypothetical protein
MEPLAIGLCSGMLQQKIFFRPPLAIARLGGSDTPVDCFHWVRDPTIHGAHRTISNRHLAGWNVAGPATAIAGPASSLPPGVALSPRTLGGRLHEIVPEKNRPLRRGMSKLSLTTCPWPIERAERGVTHEKRRQSSDRR